MADVGDRPPRGIRLEERISIAASSNRVWRMFATLEDWQDWNPLHPHAAGRWIAGRRIEMTIALPGAARRITRPLVTAVAPGRELQYRSVSLRGLIVSHRFFVIETAGPDLCTFVNGEVLGGALGRLVGMCFGARIRAGLRQMNRALKDRAERG